MAPTTTDKNEEDEPSTSTDKVKEKIPVGKFSTLEEFTKNGVKELVQATKCVNALPQGASRDLYCAYPAFGKIIDKQSERILGLISKVLKQHNVKGNIQHRQMDEQFELVQECNDIIFERLNNNFDILAGTKRKTQNSIDEPNTIAVQPSPEVKNPYGATWNLTQNSVRAPAATQFMAVKNIERPQLRFQNPVDNNASEPFVPKLREKPNSLKPLAILPEYDESGNITNYLHPYEFELLKFEPPAKQLKQTEPVKPKELKDTELLFVDSLPKLQQALEELREHKLLAIDVEHHSYRTFMGITCLMQISTREKDYVFDVIELREDVHILNEIFTDPKVMKIFHGANLDIEWLQRDLSLYVVNMFDTHQAAKVLNMARLSLAFLMKHYIDMDLDKSFQLADWRIRPLPEELIAYARQDTHYLIYIYELIMNDLLEAEPKGKLVHLVYQRSTELCKKRYAKPIINKDSHLDIMRKAKRVFDNRQLSALRDIFQWRDSVARHEDESYGYVLPNHMMLQIAESLPREMQGILACCNPIPPLVRQQLHTLHQMVLRAREQPLVKPIMDTIQSVGANFHKALDYNNKLYCPHDLSHMDEFRDDLPTLLKFDKSNNSIKAVPTTTNSVDISLNLRQPSFSLFVTSVDPKIEDIRKKKEKEAFDFWRMPYKRYCAILPLVEKQKQEEAQLVQADLMKRQLCPAEPLPIIIKQEQIEMLKPDSDDDLYRVPLKEQLKRKHASATTTKPSNDGESANKRFKHITPTDSKLNFVNIPDNVIKQEKTTDKKQSKNVGKIATAKPVESPVAVRTNKNTASEEVINVSDSDEEPGSSSTPEPSRNNRNKKINKKFKAKVRLHAQSSNKPITLPNADTANFDYKQVDFKQFRGGAQRAKGTEVKAQFHGKNNPNKATNKKFNKLFTFSNVKKGKK